MKKLKQIMLSVVALGLTALPLVPAASVSAQISDADKEAACAGLGAAGRGCNTVDAESEVSSLVVTVVDILSLIVGAASVVMLIIGGFRYVISGGDANSISAAKNTILYAIVGLVIVALAQFIVRFVLNRVT